MITKSVDAFFTKNDKVAVVKGEWGVGKTYLLEFVYCWENCFTGYFTNCL